MNSDLESLRKIKDILIQNGLYNRKEFYHEHYLKSDYWKNKREEIKEKYGYKCALCKSEENLNVHHLSYVNVDNLTEEWDHNLVCLCKSCHENIHDWKERLNTLLSKLNYCISIKLNEYKNSLDFDNYMNFLAEQINIYYPMYVNYCAFAFSSFLGGKKTRYFNTLRSYFGAGTINSFFNDTNFLRKSIDVIGEIVNRKLYDNAPSKTSSYFAKLIKWHNDLIDSGGTAWEAYDLNPIHEVCLDGKEIEPPLFELK